MNRAVNEFLAAKTVEKPALISNQARELLNLRRLPAMLNMAQTAVMLGLAEHDIPVLVRHGLLQPLGDPPLRCWNSLARWRNLPESATPSMNIGARRTPPNPSHTSLAMGINRVPLKQKRRASFGGHAVRPTPLAHSHCRSS